MRNVRGDYEHLARRQAVGDPVNHQVELAAQHADDLFMRVLMFGKCRAGIDLYPGMSDTVGMNQPRAETRKNLSHRHLLELNEWHAGSVQ